MGEDKALINHQQYQLHISSSTHTHTHNAMSGSSGGNNTANPPLDSLSVYSAVFSSKSPVTCGNTQAKAPQPRSYFPKIEKICYFNVLKK